jgi:hypothetical protein
MGVAWAGGRSSRRRGRQRQLLKNIIVGIILALIALTLVEAFVRQCVPPLKGAGQCYD